MKTRPIPPLALLCLLVAITPVSAARIVRITPENYPTILPKGKEVDAIIGDYLLTNDRLSAVVADVTPGRKANMTTPRVAGCVIDLTRIDRQSDQLTAYYPGGLQFLYGSATIVETADAAVLRCETDPQGRTGIGAAVTYELRDGADFLTVTRTHVNQGKTPARIVLTDVLRADTSFVKAPNGDLDWFWVSDNWFGQAYGVVADGMAMSAQSNNRRSTIYFAKDGSRSVEIPPGESFSFTIQLFPATNLVALRGVARSLSGQSNEALTLRVQDENDRPIGHAEVTVTTDGVAYGVARTEADGTVTIPLPTGTHAVAVEAPAYGKATRSVEVPKVQEVEFRLPAAPMLAARITDHAGAAIPCKVQFLGAEGTENPHFGPNTQGPAVHNLYYSHDGSFTWPLPRGKYRTLITCGPEYDLVTKAIEMKPGETTNLTATLARVVDSPGWISSDPHSHSTPSGDNVTELSARVLNHLAEQIEFAPCTEHNRIDSYEPVLKRLGCEHRLATCTGMELTNQPLPLNHQNAFPLVLRPGSQDNGAPQTDADPEVQIRRLALWDNASEKYVQTNHPDLGWMYFDRDGNGVRDAGFYRMFAFQDAIEVWGNSMASAIGENILSMEPITKRKRHNRLFNWMQLLNQSYRIVGVANTDAHYSDHGTGWIRNYVRSSSDDPPKIDTMEMVREYSTGHVVMTTGPYLEVSLEAGQKRAIPGDDLAAGDGKATLRVRVQCANWFDINRVAVLVNGRVDPRYDFSRATTPEKFTNEVIKFDQAIALELAGDAHVIVVATGEGLDFGAAYGPKFRGAPPTAIANPIYVDVDGKGFQANGDTLGHPLPAKIDARKRLQRLIREKAKKKRKDR